MYQLEMVNVAGQKFGRGISSEFATTEGVASSKFALRNAAKQEESPHPAIRRHNISGSKNQAVSPTERSQRAFQSAVPSRRRSLDLVHERRQRRLPNRTQDGSRPSSNSSRGIPKEEAAVRRGNTVAGGPFPPTAGAAADLPTRRIYSLNSTSSSSSTPTQGNVRSRGRHSLSETPLREGSSSLQLVRSSSGPPLDALISPRPSSLRRGASLSPRGTALQNGATAGETQWTALSPKEDESKSAPNNRRAAGPRRVATPRGADNVSRTDRKVVLPQRVLKSLAAAREANAVHGHSELEGPQNIPKGLKSRPETPHSILTCSSEENSAAEEEEERQLEEAVPQLTLDSPQWRSLRRVDVEYPRRPEGVTVLPRGAGVSVAAAPSPLGTEQGGRSESTRREGRALPPPPTSASSSATSPASSYGPAFPSVVPSASPPTNPAFRDPSALRISSLPSSSTPSGPSPTPSPKAVRFSERVTVVRFDGRFGYLKPGQLRAYSSQGVQVRQEFHAYVTELRGQRENAKVATSGEEPSLTNA